jgi:hypothetical protein
MSFNLNDVVRIGKGKVDYTVTLLTCSGPDMVEIESHNTGKRQDVEISRLTLVSAAPEREHGSDNVNEITELLNGNPWSEELTETIPSDPYTTEEISALFPGAKYALHIDGMSHGYRSFGAACDALVIAQRGEFGFAAIDHAGMRKVTRKAA